MYNDNSSLSNNYLDYQLQLEYLNNNSSIDKDLDKQDSSTKEILIFKTATE